MKVLLITSVFAAWTLLWPADAFAQGMGADRPGNSLTHQRQGGQSRPPGGKPGISGADAARIAGKQTGGRVLEVSPRGRGYNVKVYVQGKVRTVYVD